MRKGRFIDSFLYAANGFVTALREERNLRFHLCTAFYVYLFSMFYNFSKLEYAVITLMIVSVMALELVNSSLERAVDRPAPERYLSAGAVKDMAAAAVLVFSIGCAVGGVLLFWDVTVFAAMLAFFSRHILALVCLLASMVCAALFIFRNEGN